MSTESLVEAKNGLLESVSTRRSLDEKRDLRDDVERIMDVATKLFSAIERQAHRIEGELVIACGEQVRPLAQTVLQGRLNRCAKSLDASFHEIAMNLESRSSGEHLQPFRPANDFS